MATKTSKKVAKAPAKKTAGHKGERRANALPLSVGPEAVSDTESGTEVEPATPPEAEHVTDGASTANAEPVTTTTAEPAPATAPEVEPTPASGSELATPAAPSNAVETAPTRVRAFAHDDRLPPVGTTIRKSDRHGNVRCECVVEQDGIRFAGTLYPSISAAASAAAQQLGLGSKTVNGFLFFGLQKSRARPLTDPVEALTAAWERFHERAKKLVDGASDEERVKLVAALKANHTALQTLLG